MNESIRQQFEKGLNAASSGVRKRRSLHFGLVGALLGALAATFISALYLIPSTDHLGEMEKLTLLWSAISIFGGSIIVSAALGYLLPLPMELVAAWVDRNGEGKNSVRSALELKANAPDQLLEHALTALERSSTQAVTWRHDKLGFAAIGVFLVACVVTLAGYFQERLEDSPKPSGPPPTLMGALLNAAGALTGMEEFERLAAVANNQRAQTLFNDLQQLGGLLQDGKLTQGQALAEVAKLEDELNATFGDGKVAKDIAGILNSPDAPEVLELAKSLRGNTGDPEVLDRISGAMRGEGNADDQRVVGLLQRLAGNATNLQDLTRNLQDTAKGTSLLGNLFTGDTTLEEARAMSNAGQYSRDYLDAVRKQITDPNAKSQPLGSLDNTLLLVDLPERPKREKVTKISEDNSSDLRTKLTNREFVAGESDYKTRHSRIPERYRNGLRRYHDGDNGADDE